MLQYLASPAKNYSSGDELPIPPDLKLPYVRPITKGKAVASVKAQAVAAPKRKKSRRRCLTAYKGRRQTWWSNPVTIE